MKHLPLVLKNTLRNRRRTLLTVLSIGASLCLLGVLLTLYHSFFLKEADPEQARRLITRHRVSLMDRIPISYLDRIRRVPGVEDAMAFQWFGGVYRDNREMKNFFGRFAVDPVRLFKMYPDYAVSEEEKQAFIRDRRGCIVGRPLQERFGWKIGDRITIMGDQYPVNLELTIRGIYDKPRDNENLFFHDEYMREGLTGPMKDEIGTAGVLAVDAASVIKVAEAIDAMFENSPVPTKTETERAFERSFLAFMGNVKAFLLGLSGALTFTLILVSANTMAMSVRERVREIGILKTLGYTRGTILGLIVGEAMSIAVIGAFVGLGLASLLCWLIRQGPIIFADLKQMYMPPSVFAVSIGVAAVIGLVSSLPPAWSASRKPIVEALRFND